MAPYERLKVSSEEGARLRDSFATMPPPASEWKHGVFYFKNSELSVDFILAWDRSSAASSSQTAHQMRQTFEKNLEEEGLILEHEVDEDVSLNFVKIHAPLEVLKRYAEVLKLRFPLREELNREYADIGRETIVKKHMLYDEGDSDEELGSDEPLWVKTSPRLRQFLEKHVYVDDLIFPESGFNYTMTYSRDKDYLFDVGSPEFFRSKTRAMVVSFILERTLFGEESRRGSLSFGIERLLLTKVYTAAYALHDGSVKIPGSLRYTLYQQWASFRRTCSYQPLDYIREYLGSKIALYFTWLGFYTFTLLPAALAGVITFILGVVGASHDDVCSDICSANDVIMCPRCEIACEFWTLNRACSYARFISYFDNLVTPVFAMFMSVWAALFLEFWKRYSAEVTHRWGLTNYDDIEEVPRPQYLAKAEKHNKYKLNPVTGKEEKKIPKWRTIPAITLSFSIVLFLGVLAAAACVGIIVYRMSVLTTVTLYGHDDSQSAYRHASYILLAINATAATLNLIVVMGLGLFCDKLSIFLTEFEIPRTQSQFEDSATMKMYMLEFVNYYSSIFYVAFVKGRFIGYPAKYRRILGARQEECSIGGCMFDVTTQLAIIMVGKQILLSVLELLKPIVGKFVKLCSRRLSYDFLEFKSQWVQDYFLGEINIFNEYLELMLQFGFVTIFVAAFPLAPLCALINNMFECRNDAQKILKYYKRPVAQRVSNIGVWLVVLQFISKTAVLSNALIIGFTSEFIPHMVYKYTESTDGSLRGYINYSLSYMNISDLDGIDQFPANETICRYKDFREPPSSESKYDRTTTFWTVLAARLIFVLLFENVVMLAVQLIDWVIPDVPRRLRQKIRRETYIINNIIIHQAKKRPNKTKGSALKLRNK